MIDIEKIEAAYQAATPGMWMDVPREGYAKCEADRRLVIRLHNAWPQIRRELEAGKRLRTVMVGVQSIVREHGLTDTVSAIDQALAQYDRSGT